MGLKLIFMMRFPVYHFSIAFSNILFQGLNHLDGVHEFIFGQGHEPIVDA
jgi:hypothetical protein